VTGDASKIDAFIDLMKGFGIKEVARTGIAALTRGARSTKVEE
jgi:acetolactate synthase-1/3 small subunit